MKILHAPNPVLSKPAEPIKKIDKSILQLIEEMKKTLLATRDPEGVGLAAPQVGKSLQLFIAKPTKKAAISIFINPVITNKSQIPIETTQENSTDEKKADEDKPKKLEGCLSLPNIWGEVERAPIVELSYQDENGIKRTKTFKGFMSVIIQHETDHLHGVLFPKHVLEQKHKLYKATKDEKGEDIFEEIEI